MKSFKSLKHDGMEEKEEEENVAKIKEISAFSFIFLVAVMKKNLSVNSQL